MSCYHVIELGVPNEVVRECMDQFYVSLHFMMRKSYKKVV